MQSQLAAACTLCTTAESELGISLVYRREAVLKARQTAIWLHTHLDEPNHVPADSIPRMQEEIAQLEKRISMLEAQLQEKYSQSALGAFDRLGKADERLRKHSHELAGMENVSTKAMNSLAKAESRANQRRRNKRYNTTHSS